MVKNVLLWIFILCQYCSKAQLLNFFYERDSLQCYYDLHEGKLSGLYKSYYKNGIQRCEGNLINGYRNGKWILWDTAGRKRMERIYFSPFDYVRITPSPPKDTAAGLLFPNEYKLAYNKDGIIEYALVKAENAVWRHKYWRYADSTYNEILFTKNFLLSAIKTQIKNAAIAVYDTVDDRFTSIDTTAFKRINKDVSLTGLIIKEECFFDVERMCFECRILGLCPVVKEGNRTSKLGWLYYPDLRKGFGKLQIKKMDKYPEIHSLDNLFIFKYFSSVILKTTFNNPYDKYTKDYPGMTPALLKEEQLNQEINIIEEEHNLWLYFTR